MSFIVILMKTHEFILKTFNLIFLYHQRYCKYLIQFSSPIIIRIYFKAFVILQEDWFLKFKISNYLSKMEILSLMRSDKCIWISVSVVLISSIPGSRASSFLIFLNMENVHLL